MDYIVNFNSIKQNLINLVKRLEVTIISLEKFENNISIDLSFINKYINEITDTSFMISVCGKIKTGKSTLLNALMGKKDLLSIGPTPETATLIYLKYAKDPYAIIYFKDKKSIKIPISELKKYISVTEGEKILVDNTLYAEVYYPNKYLSEGITIVDTPGTDDPDQERSSITDQFVSHSDAVIFFIEKRGISDFDRRYIKSRIINNQGLKSGILLVCNRSIKNLKGKEAANIERVLNDTVVHLEKETLNKFDKIYRIEAKDALEGVIENDILKLEKSNFLVLKETIEKTLINYKGKIKLDNKTYNLLKMLIEPLKEKVRFTMTLKPENLVQKENELINIEKELKQTTYDLEKINLELEVLNKSINEWTEQKILEYLNEIFYLTTKRNADQVGTKIINAIQKINSEIKNKVVQGINNIISKYKLKVDLTSLNYYISNPEIDPSEFYNKKIITEKVETGGSFLAGAIGGLVGFFLGSAVGAPQLGGLGAMTGYNSTKSTNYIEKEIIDYNSEILLKRLQTIASNLVNQYIQKNNVTFGNIKTNSIQTLKRRKEVIDYQKESIQKAKLQTEKQFFDKLQSLNGFLENIREIESEIKIQLKKLENLK